MFEILYYWIHKDDNWKLFWTIIGWLLVGIAAYLTNDNSFFWWVVVSITSILVIGLIKLLETMTD